MKPIPFSAEMILQLPPRGIKSQTRRIMKVQPQVTTPGNAAWRDGKADLWRNAEQYARDCCPYGQPGDILYVKEAWRTLAMWDSLKPIEIPNLWSQPLKWEADAQINMPTPLPYGRYRHARFMPAAIARTKLELIAVRVERLQDISEADATAEGMSTDMALKHMLTFGLAGLSPMRAAYAGLWCEIQKAPPAKWSEPWDANPWVWVLTFKRGKDRA